MDNAEYGALYGIESLSFIITLISFSYKCFHKLHLLQNFPFFSLLYSLLVVLYRRRKLIYYIRQNGFTFTNYWAIHSPMFNYHSLIPWGSFRGRQEEKWGSFRGRSGDHLRVGDHFGVGIISGAVQAARRSPIPIKSKLNPWIDFLMVIFHG